MPFDFQRYDAKCAAMTPAELQLQWEHYTRLISGSATSTAVSGVALPLTMGVSVVGIAMAAPAIHNARKKREIIEKHLNSHGATHVTRKRDVLGSVAISGTIGVVTMGASTLAADALTNQAAEYGIQSVVENELALKVGTHVAFDAAAMAGEHAHTEHKRKKEAQKAQAMGLVAPTAYGTDVKQEVPHDGFYPVVPIPQGHSNVQSPDAANINYAYPHSTYQPEYQAPPQYTGPLPNTPFSPPAEKKEIIPGPPPLPSNFEGDSKYRLVTVGQQSIQPPPAYVAPPPGDVPVVEKALEQTYQSPAGNPQQHYPAPPLQPTNVPTYASYPGMMMSSAQAGPSNSEQSASTQYQPSATVLAPQVAAVGPPNTPASAPLDSNQSMSSPPPMAPRVQSQDPMQRENSQVQAVPTHPVHRNSLPAPAHINPVPPPLVHHSSFPGPAHQTSYPPPPPVPSYMLQSSGGSSSQNQNFAPPQQQGSYPPPPPTSPPQNSSYQPSYPPSRQPNYTTSPPPHHQHPTFAPNSFPPPPPSTGYMTPAPTPGTSYPQYIPSQHAQPTGYPTPVQTPYNECNPMAPRQQYIPEKQGFPQYQDVPIPGPQILSQQQYQAVPIPGPQILSQQGQYGQQQPQYGYPQQGNMYTY